MLIYNKTHGTWTTRHGPSWSSDNNNNNLPSVYEYYCISILKRKGNYSNNKKNGDWSYVAPRQNPTIEGSFTNGEPSGEWKVVYNKKTYKGSLADLKKKVPKLNEFSF